MAKVDDGVGKATGRDICVITGRNCKRYTRNAMVQDFKLMASRQENLNRDASVTLHGALEKDGGCESSAAVNALTALKL